MIISVDCETRGLDATKFVVGAVCNENLKTKIFYNKNELWQYILELGNRCFKQKKLLNVYAHNHQYDFYAYANITDPNIRIFSNMPFIVSYMKENKPMIKFLDTYAIYKMPLKDAALLVGSQKLETPQEYIEGKEMTKEEIENTLPYLIRDVQIVMRLILRTKEILKQNNIQVQRIMSMGQIAAQWMIKEIKATGEDFTKNLFYNYNKGQTIRTDYKEQIHEGLRGGRVEDFQTGVFNNTTYIDKNSLYPFAAMTMRFPNLKTEKLIHRPLKIYSQEELLSQIGLINCMIKNDNDMLGSLGIRTNQSTYYPKESKVLIGTWTIQEVKHAIENGYELISCAWSLTYEEELNNPFKIIMPYLYQKRKSAQNDIEKQFYKGVMNYSLGKLAQTRVGQEIFIDTVENAQQYIKRNYEIIHGIGTNYMYRNTSMPFIPKSYYTPIIPTLAYANARIIMNKEMRKINQNDLLYTDTDSIIFKGNHLNMYDIGYELGQFKIVKSNEQSEILARKLYMIADDVRMSGARRTPQLTEQFKQKKVRITRMNTIRNTIDLSLAGTFKEEIIDLEKQYVLHRKIKDILENNNLYIDAKQINIDYYRNDIAELKDDNRWHRLKPLTEDLELL